METDDYLPLSGLQHLVFCERQAALIHVEQLWMDDVATTQGALVHERVDTPGMDVRPTCKVVRALPLASAALRLRGIADLVELHPDPDAPRGHRPLPVEVKKGRSKHLDADRVQLCAQALCLEEAFGVAISEGAIFYAASHRRQKVLLDENLRTRTRAAAARLHQLVEREEVPRPAVSPRVCAKCSLKPLCMPVVTAAATRANRHLKRLSEGDE